MSRDDYPGRLSPGDYAQPEPPGGDGPRAADFCRGCDDETGGDLCSACRARYELLADMDEREMCEADRAWLKAVSPGEWMDEEAWYR